MRTHEETVTERLRQFQKQLKEDEKTFIGFPGSTDFDYSELYPFFGHLLNNVGDPYDTPLHANHSKVMEREVIDFFADLFRAPQDDRWGYVTNGGTEGNLYALYLARERYPEAVLYYSDAAHYSIPKNARLLRLPAVAVRTQKTGEIDYDALRTALQHHQHKPAILVANIGTTMTEAHDDVAAMVGIVKNLAITDYFVHSDAALAGVYTALLGVGRPFDFQDGADAVSISGHKFIGSPMACGVVLVRKRDRDAIARTAEYVGAADTTIAGSRNGHTVLMLWHAVQRWGVAGFCKRAQESLALADYTHKALRSIGWKTWRNPEALTVMLASPPPAVIRKWQLATQDGWSHVVCMPGMTRGQIDAFIVDLSTHAQ